MRNHADKLREIAGQNHALLKNVQQLLLVQPCAVGPNTFQALIRMLRTIASKCSDLAVALIRMGELFWVTVLGISHFSDLNFIFLLYHLGRRHGRLHFIQRYYFGGFEFLS